MKDIAGRELKAGQSVEFKLFGKAVGKITSIRCSMEEALIEHPDGKTTVLTESDVRRVWLRRR